MRMTFRKPKAATGLLPSRSGATVVEFAIVVPILLAIIIFIVEISIQLLTSALLQFGVREASRFGITGLPYPSSLSASPPPTREAAITQIIALKGLGILNLAHLTVTLTSYSAFNTVALLVREAPMRAVRRRSCGIRCRIFNRGYFPVRLIFPPSQAVCQE